MDFLNALVTLANFVIVPALAYGSQLALGALGVTLIYGILRFSNFAHSDTMAFGTMVVVLLTGVFQGWGVGLGPLPTALLALPFGMMACMALMLLTGPILAWIVTGGETPYRVLRATAPWKYLGFALGGTVMTFGLIALSQHRPSWRLAALAFVATLVIALLYDLPFDNLLLPPNGDF